MRGRGMVLERMDNLSQKSAWSQDQLQQFLLSACIPIRISAIDGDYPFICSVWFEYTDGKLLVVSHKDSKLARTLLREGRCAFEIAPNDPPYCGVRGKADVEAGEGDAEATLKRLIERYLGDTNQGLASWLLGRAADEVVFTLHPTWATSWDYGGRMESADI